MLCNNREATGVVLGFSPQRTRSYSNDKERRCPMQAFRRQTALAMAATSKVPSVSVCRIKVFMAVSLFVVNFDILVEGRII